MASMKFTRNEGYPAWVPLAVARSRRISGRKPESGGSTTLSYPGPKQHVAIRETVTEMLDERNMEVTPANILELAGTRSMKALVDIASWRSPAQALVPMRPLSSACARRSGVHGHSDGWASGRYLAAALVAWIEELKANDEAPQHTELVSS